MDPKQLASWAAQWLVGMGVVVLIVGLMVGAGVGVAMLLWQ